MTSRWRTEARELIADTIHTALEETPALIDDLSALFAIVGKAYPQKPRKGEAFDVWLGELAYARKLLTAANRSRSPLARRCAACFAAAFKPCVPIDETDSILSERQLATEMQPRSRARELAASIVHSARRSEERLAS